MRVLINVDSSKVYISVELYQAKRTEKILFSGGIILKDKTISEAVMMKERAVKLGVDKKDI